MRDVKSAFLCPLLLNCDHTEVYLEGGEASPLEEGTVHGIEYVYTPYSESFSSRSAWNAVRLEFTDLKMLTGYSQCVGILGPESVAFPELRVIGGARHFRNVGSVQLPKVQRISGVSTMTDMPEVEIRYMELKEIIGDDIFAHNAFCETVSFPELMNITGDGTFREMHSLREADLPACTGIMGSETFYNAGRLSCVRMESLERLEGSRTFFGCEALTSVSLPALQVLHGNLTFMGTQSLNCVYMDSLQELVGNSIFSWSPQLRKAEFPSLRMMRGSNVFKHCLKLTSMVLPFLETLEGYEVFPQSIKQLVLGSEEHPVQRLHEEALVGMSRDTDINIWSVRDVPEVLSYVFPGMKWHKVV